MLRLRISTTLCTAVLLASMAACSKDPAVAKRDFVQSGDDYVSKKKYPEAIIQYRNAIGIDPRFGEARLKLADIYMQSGDTQNAYNEYVRAADLLPQSADAQVKTGQLLLLAHRFEDAKSRADKALAVDQKNVAALILKGNALAGLRDIDGAIAQVEAAIKSNPSEGRSYSSLGALQLVKGDAVLAEKAFRQAVESDPKSVPAHLALANFYWATGRKAETEAALVTTLTLDPKSVVANRALATFFLASGRAPEAEQPLKVVADATPDASGRLALADYYLSAKRVPEAKALLEQAASLPNGFAPARLKLAGLAETSGARAEAYRLLDEVLKKEPKQLDALAAKAQLQVADGKSDDALATIRAGLTADPNSAALHLLHGQILASRDESAGAIAAYKDALRLNPKLSAANAELARLYLSSGKPAEAVQFAQSALQLAPGYSDALLLLARAQLATRDIGGAEGSLKKLNAAYPDAPIVQVEMGRVYLNKGDRVQARAAFQRALDKDSAQLAALEGLTLLDLQERKSAEARARLEGAIAKAPRSDALYLLAGRTYASLQDPANAEKALTHALELNPNNLQVYAALGQFYVNEKRLPEATTEFEKLAKKQPSSVGPQVALGVLFQLQKRNDEARTRYEKALELDPHASVAANNLAWMYAETETNLDVALRLAQTAKSQLPDVAEVNDTLGWIYQKKGLSSLAIAPLQQSVAKDPGNASYHYHLGLAYAANGQDPKAREALKRAIQLKLTPEETSDAEKQLARLKG